MLKTEMIIQDYILSATSTKHFWFQLFKCEYLLCVIVN